MTTRSAADGPPPPGRRAAPRRRRANTWLLAVPLLGLVWPPLYNRLDPVVLGVPFFYSYQLVMIVIALACMIAVYRGQRR